MGKGRSRFSITYAAAEKTCHIAVSLFWLYFSLVTFIKSTIVQLYVFNDVLKLEMLGYASHAYR